jgi:hypothetical protein
MGLRSRYLLVALVGVATIGVIGKRLLYPKIALHAATISSSPAQSFLIALGVGDPAGTVWDGYFVLESQASDHALLLSTRTGSGNRSHRHHCRPYQLRHIQRHNGPRKLQLCFHGRAVRCYEVPFAQLDDV